MAEPITPEPSTATRLICMNASTIGHTENLNPSALHGRGQSRGVNGFPHNVLRGDLPPGHGDRGGAVVVVRRLRARAGAARRPRAPNGSSGADFAARREP